MSPTSLSIVTPFYPPHIGGIERYTQQFARAAVELGLHVNVVTTGNVECPTLADDGRVELLLVPARQVPMSGATFPIPSGNKYLWRRFLEADVIVAQTRFFLTSLWTARMAGQQIHVIDHGAGPLRSSLFGNIAMGYEHVITKMLRRYNPRFYGVSSASVRWLQEFGIKASGIVPNGVEPCTSPQRNAEGNVIFYAGRLLPEKGIAELIEAVKMVGNVELRLAGPGPLAELAASDPAVTYLGVLSPKQVREELSRATVLVNPSNLREGAPSILLEAACAGCPVISTPADVVEDGSNAWVIQRGDVNLIASALRAALNDRAEAQRRGESLYRFVQGGYTWPTIVRRFLSQI